ncbi:hypothetical protein DYE49_11935 [Treponema rectale]|uniref:Uncharacterized protein n=1 Tax=Treponema rectale TaxID=744512 RepID=A0A840SE08_9SPIR|nr:hypothetical protein [Treponema rectale]MBB5218970.1 hypothetical protein [Treponema rectale]QOS41118.1 hypothetical protein DYE49_11935 [Treponema rectale]
MKKLILISTYLALSLAVHAEKKYITDGFGIWSTEDFKKFTPVLACTNPILGAGSIKTIQIVDIYDRFILYKKMEHFDEYQFEFYSYKDSKHSPIYTVNRKNINRELDSAFYSENCIFCLEHTINSNYSKSDFYITKRTVDSLEVVLEYKLDKSSFKVSCTGPMYVDEKNDRFLCQCSKYRKDGRLEYFLKIMSLSTGKELFLTETNYLTEVFAEDGKVYLSVQNKLFTANYTDENISLHELKTFVPEKKKIIAIRKNGDIYVLRTEHKRFNPVHRFIFGSDSTIWSYYVCKIQDGELVKVKKLKKNS